MCSEPAEISVAFIDYYKNLFNIALLEGVNDCITGVEERVTTTMNNQLLRPFIEDEVTTVLA